ncbi:MAG: divergent polysaccharide deacetylase family protein [Fibrobacteraceae bacterium]|mgnify:CR=1 FL=1|nr:divergent polysaccharide deacetylase family protein [Fibrobacteraceae bacterium]
MNKLKHIVALFFIALIVFVLVFLLPKTELGSNLVSKVSSKIPQATSTADTAIIDTVPLKDKLQEEMKVIKSNYSKRKQRDVWTLGKGNTIITYLLQAQKFIEKNNGSILYMEELFNIPDVFQAADMDALDKNGDTLKVQFQISENIFKDNASLLSIAFQVSSLTPERVEALKSYPFPYTLLISPFGMANGFYDDLNKILKGNEKKREVVLWMAMESNKLNSRHNKYRPLRIHHSEEEIEETITEALRLLPSAKGIATRYAEQAVTHRKLLQAVLKPAQDKSLWFMDLSNNKLSRVPETCEEFPNVTCRLYAPYNPDNSTLDDYVSRRLKAARRSGTAIMILPLDEKTIQKMDDIQKKAEAQSTNIKNLSTFIKY